MKKAAVCHQCHAPRSDPVHVGVACGVGTCPLEHWQGCTRRIPEGTKDKKGGIWTACPDLEFTVTDSDTEEDTDEEVREAPGSGFSVEGVQKKLPASIAAAAALMEEGLGLGDKRLESSEESDSSSEDEELRLQRDEYQRLQLEFDLQAKKAAAKQARKNQKQMRLAQEKAELAQKMKDLKLKSSSLSTPSAANTGQMTGPSPGTGDRNLKDKVSEHQAKKQRKSAGQRQAQQQGLGSGLTMPGIRSLPEVRQEVEDYISKLKSIVPTLASDPTASGFNSSTFQPDGVYSSSNHAQKPEAECNYVYVAELGRVVPIVEKLDDLHSVSKTRPVPNIESSESDSECSEDDDCSLEPPQGSRFVWKKHKDGTTFFKQVQIKTKPKEFVATYQLDEDTGNYERVMVPATNKQKKGKGRVQLSSGTIPKYKDHRVLQAKASLAPVWKEDRLPSFVSGDSEKEKQGKESRIPSLVRFARDCPVSWTNKVTSTCLNPVLFSWAYFAELLATRTGQLPSLEDGELEARLQHFLSVMEVTLQTTGQNDFDSESWKVSRLYHQKVQDKVDAGTYSWLQLSRQWGTASLPHELMAANAELAPKFVKKKVARGGDRAGAPSWERDSSSSSSIIPLCSSWNNSETKGKCKWEAENEGKKCYRQHYCSWCKRESNQINFHQKSFCKKQQDKEGE